jgi:hypothetical protein
MDNQPSFDRSLLIPIGVALFSLLGICIILVGGRIASSPGEVEVVPSATAFEYMFIGTEPVDGELPTEAPTEASTEAPIVLEPTTNPDVPTVSSPVIFPTNTLASIITLAPVVTPNTPTKTPTSAFAAPFNSGTFDDTDSRFVYSGSWRAVPGTSFDTTLHVSDTIGNSVKFLYYGNELHVFYQVGPSLGTIRLTLDQTSYAPQSLNNSTTARYEWILAPNTISTHTVTVTHDSGGSVNFDGIIVSVIPVTPTSTSNQ